MKVVAYYMVLTSIGIFMIAVNITAWVLIPFTSAARRQQIIRAMILATIRCNSRLVELFRLGSFTFTGFRSPPDGKPQIYIANHTGMLDAAMLMIKIPNMSCIFKARLRRNPLLSHIPAAIGFVANDDKTGLVRSMIQQIERGTSVLIFPEGTRTEHPPVEPFKPGFAIVAKQTGSTVQTIFIHNPTGMTGKKRRLHSYPNHLPFPYHFRFGPLLTIGTDETAREFTDRAEQLFRKELTRPPSSPNDRP